VLAFRTAPQVVLMLVGSVIADRVKPAKVMLAADTSRGITQALVALLLVTGHAQLWQLCLLLALYGAVSAFYFPASRALLPDVVPSDLIQPANALSSMAFSSSQIGGPLSAGLMLTVASPGSALLVDAASFFASPLFISRLVRVSRPRPTKNTFRADGWRQVRHTSWLRTTLAHASVFQLVTTGALKVLGPLIHVIITAARGVGHPADRSGFGSVVGGALALRRLSERAVPIAYCVLLMTTTPALLALGAALPIVATAVAICVYGLGLTLFDTIWHSSVQRMVSPDSLGRISSFDAIMSMGLRPVGLAVAGPIGYAFGTRSTLIGAGVLTAVATGLVIVSPAVRRLRIVDERQAASVDA